MMVGCVNNLDFCICREHQNRQMPTKYKDIWGWFNGSQQHVYDRIAETIADGEKILEIGALLGRSTCYLAERLQELGKPNVQIYVVDPWDTNTCTSSERWKKHLLDRYESDLYPHFEEGLRKAGVWHMIRPFQMTSDEAYQLLAAEKQPQQFRFVFLDGDHRREQVIKDIQNFQKLRLSPTSAGFIAGDDYKGGGGVKDAVDHVFGEGNYQLVGDPLYPAWMVVG